MSISDPNVLINLYDWLENIPFSRPKKNFARDFSDALLAAELVKHFFPSMVQVHNYPTTNKVEQKKINWSVLNLKVLRKLDFPISDATINELASGSRKDATEYFLYTLREKIWEHMNRTVELMKKKKEDAEDVLKLGAGDVLKESCEIEMDSMSTPERAETVFMASDGPGKSKAKPFLLVDSALDKVPREIYDQKVQELLASEEMIQVLKARIQRLETILHIKNAALERQQQALEKLRTSRNASPEKTRSKATLKKS